MIENEIEKQKFILRFVYQADVIPAGSRKPRRQDFSASAEFSVVKVAPSDLQTEAFVGYPEEDLDGNDHCRIHTLAAWGGRLWSPMRTSQPDTYRSILFEQPAFTIESYLAQFVDTPPEVEVHRTASDDPILNAYDVRFASSGFSLPHPDVVIREEDFVGKVVWSNRGEALQQHLHAADSVLFADDAVYARRVEPHWRVTQNGLIDLCGAARERISDEYAEAFRLDRLDDAVEWRKARRLPVAEILGSIVTLDKAILKRDDLSCLLAERLPEIASRVQYRFLEYIAPATVQAWKTLCDASATTVKAARYDDRVGHDDGFSMDSQDALAALGQITDGVRAAVLPTDMLPVRDGLLKSISQILARVDFEMLHAKTATLEGVDEVALTRLTA